MAILKRLFSGVCTVVFASAIFFGVATIAATPDARIIVKIAPEATALQVAQLDRMFGNNVEDTVPELGIRVLNIPSAVATEAVIRLKKINTIDYVEVDAIAEAAMVPNDPYYPDQWGMEKIDAETAWDYSDGVEIPIAILDTGIDYNHTDLKANISGSANFTSTRSALDKNGHGTHVAGVTAGVTNNARGIAGLAFKAKLLNGKVLADNGSGYYSWIAKGIVWATDSGAKVINLSLGGNTPSQALADAVDYAVEKGVVVVAAAGNNAATTPFYPAYYEPVIAVGATDLNDARASFSNFGNWVDVAAPGVNIISTYPRVGKIDRYAWMSGTSMAAPFVSGLAGLVWAEGIFTTNAMVRTAIETSAHPLPLSLQLGAGRIDAAETLSP